MAESIKSSYTIGQPPARQRGLREWQGQPYAVLVHNCMPVCKHLYDSHNSLIPHQYHLTFEARQIIANLISHLIADLEQEHLRRLYSICVK